VTGAGAEQRFVGLHLQSNGIPNMPSDDNCMNALGGHVKTMAHDKAVRTAVHIPAVTFLAGPISSNRPSGRRPSNLLRAFMVGLLAPASARIICKCGALRRVEYVACRGLKRGSRTHTSGC
jgi:hypothetical protein